MNKIILQCQNLYKWYQEGKSKIYILRDINFNISEGEMIAIVGSSGSGKSTLLHLLSGFDKPSSGEIIFSGQLISKLSTVEKANLRNQKLGFIYQFHHLLLDFTVFENVAMPLLIAKKKLKEISSRVNNMLKAVGLNHRSNHRPSQLSGGERQRVSIARALINHPQLVLADEPTGNLDIRNTDAIFQLITELNITQGIAFLIATHDVKLINRINRHLEIQDGQLINTNLNNLNSR